MKQQDAPVGERRRYSTDPKTFHALLALAGESSADKLSQAITRAIAQTMLADLCFLIYLTDNKNQMQIASGYDLIREENLEGGSLNKKPDSHAHERPPTRTSVEAAFEQYLCRHQRIERFAGSQQPGALDECAHCDAEKDPLGGVLLLSPYSNRLWSAEDQAFLTNIAISLVPIIQRGQKMTSLEQKGEQTKQALDVAQSRIEDLEKRNNDLLNQMEAVKGRRAAGTCTGRESGGSHKNAGGNSEGALND